MRADEIDLLICCNISRYDGPYRFSLEPATAARIARRFGLVNAVAFDLSNACAGTFTAILLADTLLRQGVVRRVLIVSGEYITHLMRTAQQEIAGFMDPRLPCLTLGDSGVALLLGRAPTADVGFQEVELYTLGKYHDLCVAKLSAVPGSGPVMHTDSVTSTVVTIKQAVGHAAEMLRRRRWDLDTVKGLVIHQTSETTLDGAVQEINRALGQPFCHRGNTLYNVAERGNTATNTHFLAVYEAIQAGRFAAGERLVFAVSGSGQTVGTALYTFDDLPERLRQPPRPREAAPARPAEPLRHFHCQRRVRLESIATVDRSADGPAETIDLVRRAGEACLERSARPRDEIDVVIHTGVYRSEFLAEPSVASIAAGELAINHDDKQLGERRTLAFDVLNGAGGTLTACLLSAELMAARKFSRALVIASEVEPCRELRPEGHAARAEAASALVLEESGGSEGFAAFGFRAFPEHLDAIVSATGVHEDKPAVFHHRDAALEDREVECVCRVVREFLARESLSPADVGLLVPPQRPGRLGERHRRGSGDVDRKGGQRRRGARLLHVVPGLRVSEGPPGRPAHGRRSGLVDRSRSRLAGVVRPVLRMSAESVMTDAVLTNESSRFRVLRSESGRQSLWPAHKPIPAGWREVLPASTREDCLEYVRRQGTAPTIASPRPTRKTLAFGLLFFGGDEGEAAAEKYELVIEAARYADAAGFSAVWLPERHFTAMGSLYPNPAVLHAALARETRRIRLRAGSVVLPLHDPLRVAEEWAVVDNLSKGRIELSFAPGWNAEDFALHPARYARRYETMYDSIRVVEQLWSGQSIEATDGCGQKIRVRTYPTPVQKRLPLWITAAGSPRSFQQAGEIGANVLTHLFDQGVEELAEKVALYRRARAEHGWDPDAGRVAVTLHTYLADDPEDVRRNAYEPYCDYLKKNLKLLEKLAQSRNVPIALDRLTPAQLDEAIRWAFEKFLRQRSLMGTPDDCVELVGKLVDIGVQEIACLLDFGPASPAILAGLPRLRELMERFQESATAACGLACSSR